MSGGDVLFWITGAANRNAILAKERDEALEVLRELAHGEYTDELGNRAIAILAKHKDQP